MCPDIRSWAITASAIRTQHRRGGPSASPGASPDSGTAETSAATVWRRRSSRRIPVTATVNRINSSAVPIATATQWPLATCPYPEATVLTSLALFPRPIDRRVDTIPPLYPRGVGTKVTCTLPKVARPVVVTRWEWLRHAVPSWGMGPVRTWSDARRVGAYKPAQLLFFAVVAAAVALLAVIGHCVPLRSPSQSSHSAVPLLSSVSTQTAGTAHQPLLFDGKSICKTSKLWATAALPKLPPTSWMLLGVVVAGLLLKDLPTKLVGPAGRGPPGAPAAVGSGRDVLTLFCLARR